MTRRVALSVDDVPVEIDYFVQSFIDHTIGGMAGALEGVVEIGSLDVSIKGDKVVVDINGKAIALNPFVNRLVKSTLDGLLLPLKGVCSTDGVKLHIDRRLPAQQALPGCQVAEGTLPDPSSVFSG